MHLVPYRPPDSFHPNEYWLWVDAEDGLVFSSPHSWTVAEVGQYDEARRTYYEKLEAIFGDRTRNYL